MCMLCVCVCASRMRMSRVCSMYISFVCVLCLCLSVCEDVAYKVIACGCVYMDLRVKIVLSGTLYLWGYVLLKLRREVAFLASVSVCPLWVFVVYLSQVVRVYLCVFAARCRSETHCVLMTGFFSLIAWR